MSPAEALVLATATVLAAAALVERRSGALGPRASRILLALGVLGVALALLHMEGRVMAAW